MRSRAPRGPGRRRGRGSARRQRTIADDEARNDIILNDVIAALEEGRSPILLTKRRDHLEFFERILRGVARNLVVLRGGMGAKKRAAIARRFEEIPREQERLVLATGRYIGEGFDDARLDTLFLALPVSWKGTLVQYAGRLERRGGGRERSGSSTTSTAPSRCSRRCSGDGCGGTRRSGTACTKGPNTAPAKPWS